MSDYITVKYTDGHKATYRARSVRFYNPLDGIPDLPRDGTVLINQLRIEWAREADRYEVRDCVR